MKKRSRSPDMVEITLDKDKRLVPADEPLYDVRVKSMSAPCSRRVYPVQGGHYYTVPLKIVRVYVNGAPRDVPACTLLAKTLRCDRVHTRNYLEKVTYPVDDELYVAYVKFKRAPPCIRGALRQGPGRGTCQSNAVVNLLMLVPELVQHCRAEIQRELLVDATWPDKPSTTLRDVALRAIYRQSCSGLALHDCVDQMDISKRLFFSGDDEATNIMVFDQLGLPADFLPGRQPIVLSYRIHPFAGYTLRGCLMTFDASKDWGHKICCVLCPEPWLVDSNGFAAQFDWRMSERDIAPYFALMYRMFVYVKDDFIRRWEVLEPPVICGPPLDVRQRRPKFERIRHVLLDSTEEEKLAQLSARGYELRHIEAKQNAQWDLKAEIMDFIHDQPGVKLSEVKMPRK